MFEKVIVAKSRVKFDVYCTDHGLNPRKQIHVRPDDVRRVAGLELSEDQVVIIDQPSEELLRYLDAMTRRAAPFLIDRGDEIVDLLKGILGILELIAEDKGFVRLD